MRKLFATLLIILALVIGTSFGGYVERTVNPRLDQETIEKNILGKATCARFKVGVLSGNGVIKQGEQLLCGYHMEWGNIFGGNSSPFEFAPDPKSNL